jgi:hypothetical protein
VHDSQASLTQPAHIEAATRILRFSHSSTGLPILM